MIKKSAAKKTTKKTASKKASVKKQASKKSASKKITTKKTKDSSIILSEAVVEGMLEKKAKNIKILDLRSLQNRVSDIFVIAEAESTTHVNSIADSVSETVKKMLGEKPFHSEGWENSQWILLDYVNVVAHVFMNETREFYNIEGLWADATITQVN